MKWLGKIDALFISWNKKYSLGPKRRKILFHRMIFQVWIPSNQFLIVGPTKKDSEDDDFAIEISAP